MNGDVVAVDTEHVIIPVAEYTRLLDIKVNFNLMVKIINKMPSDDAITMLEAMYLADPKEVSNE